MTASYEYKRSPTTAIARMFDWGGAEGGRWRRGPLLPDLHSKRAKERAWYMGSATDRGTDAGTDGGNAAQTTKGHASWTCAIKGSAIPGGGKACHWNMQAFAFPFLSFSVSYSLTL